MNMEEGYIIRDQKLPHFITATAVDWIDLPAGRQVYFQEKYIATKSLLL
jgi:hypothetical protein